MMTDCVSHFFELIGYVYERDFTYNKSVYDYDNHYDSRSFNVNILKTQKLHIHSSYDVSTCAEVWITGETKVKIPNIRALLEFLSTRFDHERKYAIEDIPPSSFKKMRVMLEEFVAFMTASRDGCNINKEFVVNETDETM